MFLRWLSVCCLSVVGAQVAWGAPKIFQDLAGRLPRFGGEKRQAQPTRATTWYVKCSEGNRETAGTIQIAGLALKGQEASDCLSISLIVVGENNKKEREATMQQYAALLKTENKDAAHQLVGSLRSRKEGKGTSGGCADVLCSLLNAGGNHRLLVYKEDKKWTVELVTSRNVEGRCQELRRVEKILKDASKTFFVEKSGKENCLTERNPAAWRQMTKLVRTQSLEKLKPHQLVVGQGITWEDIQDHQDSVVKVFGVPNIRFLDAQVKRSFEDALPASQRPHCDF